MNEKLSFNRITPSALVYVELESDNGGMLLSASEDGFCFRAVTSLKPSGPVSFAILLGAKQRLEGKGKLVWSEEEGRKGGILFTEVTPQFRREFETWLHRKENRGSAPAEAKADIRHVPPTPEEPKPPAPKIVKQPPLKLIEMPPRPVPSAPKTPQKEKREEESTPAVPLDDLERALRKQQPRAEPPRPAKSAPEPPPPVAPADPAVVQPESQQRIEEPPCKSSPPAAETSTLPAASTLEKISQGFRLETPIDRKSAEPPAMTLKIPVQAETDSWTGLPRISLKPPASLPQEPRQPPPQQIAPEPKAADVSRVEEAPPTVAANEPVTLENLKSELSSEPLEEPVSSVPDSATQEPPEPALQERIPEEPAQEPAQERVSESMEEPFAPAAATPPEDSIAEPVEASHADLMGRIGIAPSHVLDTTYSEAEAGPRHGIGAVYKTIIVLIVLGVLAIVAVRYRRPLGEAVIRLGQMIAGEPGPSEVQPPTTPPQSAASNPATQQSATPSGQDAANATDDSAQPPASSANNSAAQPSTPAPTPPSASPDSSSANPANGSAISQSVTQPASKPGNGRVEFDEARKLLHGDHRKRDMAKAVELLKIGVSHGYPPAEVTLGDLYARGDGVPKDCAQARTLLQSGARSGSPEARRMLAKLKSEGCP